MPTKITAKNGELEEEDGTRYKGEIKDSKAEGKGEIWM